MFGRLLEAVLYALVVLARKLNYYRTDIIYGKGHDSILFNLCSFVMRLIIYNNLILVRFFLYTFIVMFLGH